LAIPPRLASQKTHLFENPTPEQTVTCSKAEKVQEITRKKNHKGKSQSPFLLGPRYIVPASPTDREETPSVENIHCYVVALTSLIPRIPTALIVRLHFWRQI